MNKQARWRSRNRTEEAARNRDRYRNLTPEQKAVLFDQKWVLNLRKNFGLTPADYQGMLDRQGGTCRLCSRTNGKKRLCVDHCHRTGIIRGLLCTRCNKGLGIFEDDAQLLLRAVEYLKGAPANGS